MRLNLAFYKFGNNRQLLLDAVTQLLPFIGYPRSLNAIAAINDITSKQ